MNAIIVIPTIRKESIKKWLESWKKEFRNHQIFIVEDNDKKTFDIDQNNVTHFCYQDIEKDLKDKAWIINRKDCSIWAYGAWKAYQKQPDMIVVLSDDCFSIENDFLNDHWKKLNLKVSNEWLNPLWELYPRGFPYKNRDKEVVLNMGLWENIPDVDAITQLSGYNEYYKTNLHNLVVPKNTYFALCDMNIAFKSKIVPYIYEFEKNRFGDIWAGIRLKRYCDENNYAITLGDPIINHIRMSNPYTNLQKECVYLEENETFYQNLIPERYADKIKTWMSLFK